MSTPLPDVGFAAEGTSPPRTAPPISAVMGLLVGVLLLAAVSLPLRDVDLYWHLRAGSELLQGASVRAVGSTWSFAPDPRPWVTTQWLSEVLLRLLHDLAGWPALIGFRTLTAVLALVLLAGGTLSGRPKLLAAFPFLAAATATLAVSQERPNQVTLVGAAALGPVLLNGLGGRLPRWWICLPATWLWANLHGGWVLVPGALMLVALGRFFEHGLRDRSARGAGLLSVGTLAVGSLTPAGLTTTSAALRFSQAASGEIQEWMRTVPLEGLGVLVTAMGLILAIGWVRGGVPRSEATATILLVLFALTAVRNVAPALLMLAPLAAQRLCTAYPDVGRGREPYWSPAAGLIICAVLALASLASVPHRQLLPVDSYPIGLAGKVADLEGGQRVLNDYNVAGFVLFFAGQDDRVGIDGRTDRYGAEYLESYINMQALEGDWERTLEELDPTSAILRKEGPLAHVLTAERGWSVVAVEGEWALLQRH